MRPNAALEAALAQTKHRSERGKVVALFEQYPTRAAEMIRTQPHLWQTESGFWNRWCTANGEKIRALQAEHGWEKAAPIIDEMYHQHKTDSGWRPIPRKKAASPPASPQSGDKPWKATLAELREKRRQRRKRHE